MKESSVSRRFTSGAPIRNGVIAVFCLCALWPLSEPGREKLISMLAELNRTGFVARWQLTASCRAETSAVQRVSRLPLVRSALQSVTSAYTEVKGRYPLLGLVGGAAELSVRSVSLAAMQRASPLLLSLEPQMEVANGYACVGLDRLERSFPVLQQSTDEVMGHLKDAFFLTLDDVQVRVVDGLDGALERLERLSEAGWAAVRALQDSQVGRVATSGLDEVLSRLEDATAYYLPLPPTLRREWEMRVQEYEEEDEDEEPGLWTRLRSLLLSLSLQLYHRLLKLRERLERAARPLGAAADTVSLELVRPSQVGLGRVLEAVGFLLQHQQRFMVALVYRVEGLRELALVQVKGQAALLAELGPVRQMRELPSQVQVVLRDLQDLAKILLQLVVNSTPLYSMLQQPSEQDVEDFLSQEDFVCDSASRRSSANSLFLKAMDGRPRRRKSLYSRARRGSGSGGSANSPQGAGSAPPGPANGRRPSLKQEAPALEIEGLPLPSESAVHRRASATDLLLGPLMQFVSQSQKAFEYLSPGPNADEANSTAGTADY
ncbi:perilipin 6 [Centroberyx affinis]|uniref:perilipin 6 n=1 Tax=Centroberyx affinis TaxID=166261 RepID=UPI003A5BD611